MLNVANDVIRHKTAEAQLLRLSQLYSALSQCNRDIARCTSEAELFPQVCRDSVMSGGMKMAWVGLLDEASRQIKPVAAYGDGKDYLVDLDITVNADEARGCGPTGTAIRENQPVWCQDFLNDPCTAPWLGRAAKVGWAASASLPLQRFGKVIGAITLYADQVNAFDEDVRKLLQAMALDISFALDNYAREASRKEAEAALRKSEAFNLAILDSVAAEIAVLDRDGQIIAVNEPWRRFVLENSNDNGGPVTHADFGTGYLLACRVSADGAAEDVLKARDGIRAVLDARLHRFSMEYPCHSPQEQRWFIMSVSPLGVEGGGAVVAHANITERKLAQEALDQSNQRIRDLVDATDGIIWEADAETFVFSFVSRNAERMLGHPVADWLQPGFWASHIHPDDRDQAIGYCVACTGRREDHEFEYRFIAQDGRAVWMADIVKVVAVDGKPRRLRGLMVDITGRKQAEATRASLEAQLRESQKMQAIGTLAGGIAHDFNNILATILGNTELARQDLGNNPGALESLEEIRKAGSRARDLVQQILSFSRRQPTERKLTALCTVVEDCVRLLRATMPARLTLTLHCDAEVPPVLADVTQIQQLLINLVNNATQAMPEGPGHIGVRVDTAMLDTALAHTHPALRALHDKHAGRTVRLVVSDDGPGMEAATLERIFEPFSTTRAVDEGTGLGLSVVHGIVKAHEGAITVQSQPGKGTTFTLYLPAAEVRADAPHPGESTAAPATGPASNAAGGQHILYIDDDESLVFLVQRLLERRGYRISGYTDQREALDALDADPASFDLVVTDYNMPGMSGLDVAREVRKVRADLPVAVASGFIDETLRAQADGAGVRELIFKANAIEEFCDAFVRLAQSVGEVSRTG